jgi:thioredoxin reductase (NADPH)
MNGDMDHSLYDVFVVGGGPAGLTAGIYCARNGLRVAVASEGVFGGTVSSASLVENYPGFPEGILGADLGERFRQHAENSGAELITERIEAIRTENGYFELDGGATYYSKTVILALGITYRHLGVPGEREFSGRGVSYCATCDGAFFRNKTVAVVGGGSSAFSSAEYLANLAQKVYLIHRRTGFRAERVLVDRVLGNKKVVPILNKTVRSINGEKKVDNITVEDVATGEKTILPVDGVFIQIGEIPNSDLVRGLVDLDENGYIKVDEMMRTSKDGAFAAGDVRSKALGQIVTAAADGAIAAEGVFKYLNEKGL